MTARQQEIEEIFLAAFELASDERAKFLDEACGDDELLRNEIESLLHHKEKPNSPFDSPSVTEAVELLIQSYDESLVGKNLDHFKILAPLGAGGMARVYRAEDLRLNRNVALKLLPSISFQDESQVHRFRQEAQAASSLNHPNIITIHEIGQADSLHYIAMELIRGETLRQHLRGGRLPMREALGIAIQVAEALSAAHRAGIVHRDIKPENVMLREDGYAKVVDFGIAKLKEQKVSPDPQSQSTSIDASSSVMAGTVSYMSPEQVRGEQLDARSDLFSLGIVLFEMVTGRRPFEGENVVALREAILNNEPPGIGTLRQNVSPDLEKILYRTLKKDRDARYQSAGEMLADLKELKNRLESGTAGEKFRDTADGFASRGGPRNTAVTAIASKRAMPFFLTGLLSAIATVCDIVLLQHWAMRDTALLLVSILCFITFARVREKVGAVSRSTEGSLAFRGLASFSEADRDRFYGREKEIACIFEMVSRKDFRFGVLHASSGAGKTSLLEAGLLPRLRNEGYTIVRCRSYKDPLSAIIDECRKLTDLRANGLPSDCLRLLVEDFNTAIIVICDQFEEFFINFRSKREREPFVSFVSDVHHDAHLPVKFLFSIRSDFLYLISQEFDNRINEPLMGDKRYQLRNFNEEQAEQIIERTAFDAGSFFEPSLPRSLAADLAVDDAVLPSELQIVGEQLQKKGINTYESYRRAGGKEQLVGSYVEECIEETREQETARLLLRSLISDEDRRLMLSLAEIVNRTQRSHASVNRVLKHFVEARLVREIQDQEPWRHELMHDYLIEKVNVITGKVLDATQRANRAFRQYLSNYSVDRRARIPINRLWSIWRYSNIPRGEREHGLLVHSLRAAMWKAPTATLLLVILATLAAAMLSQREEWEGIRLGDGHTAGVRRAVFSPDGKLLVSVGEDSRIIAWDFARRERLRTFTDHTKAVTAVAFSPDGEWFVTASEDHTVIVWNTVRLEKVKILREHRGPAASLAFSPNGAVLASASYGEDPRTVLWRVADWEKVGEVPVGVAYGPVLFSPNGHQLLFSGQTWDLTRGQKVDEAQCGNGKALSPDARVLVCVTGNGDVEFTRLSLVGDFSRRETLNNYHVHRDNGRAAAFSPDGRLVATGAEDIILWDAATQSRIARLKHAGIVWDLAFSPDGRWLVSSHGDGAILVWDVAERETAGDFTGHSASVRAVTFSSDGKRIASASEDRSVIVWDAESGHKEAVLLGHETRVTAVAFSPKATSLASIDQDGTLIYWDLARRARQWSYSPMIRQGFCVAISPDGRLVASIHGVHETTSGILVFDVWAGTAPLSGIYGAAFSPDGKLLTYVTTHGDVYLLDTQRWQILHRANSNNPLVTVSFSADGEWLVTGEDLGMVRLWSISPLREVAVIGRHPARVKSVAFAPDGQRVVSASDDRTIALWDVAHRRLVGNIGTHTAPVLSVAFSPDGRRLVSGEHDSSIHLYTHHRTLWGYQLE